MTYTAQPIPVEKEGKQIPTGRDGTNHVPILVDASGKLQTTTTLETGDIEIGAVEIKNGTDDTRATVSTVGSTTQIHTGIFNASGEQINSFGSPQLNGTHRSPVHFTATYTSTSTLTLGGAPTISDNSQVVGIQVTNAANITTQYIAGADGVSFGVSGSVITMYKSGVAYTQFVNTDLSYRVVLNLTPIAQDKDLNHISVGVDNPDSEKWTDPEAIISTAYELTASFADVGSEIDVRSYTYMSLWVTIDIGTSTNPQLRILHKHTSGGTEEYREIYLGSPATNITTINLNDYEIASDADQLFKITLPVIGTHYIQVQAKDDADGDGQIDALYVTKQRA